MGRKCQELYVNIVVRTWLKIYIVSTMETSVSLNPKVLLEIYPSNKDRREARTANNVRR